MIVRMRLPEKGTFLRSLKISGTADSGIRTDKITNLSEVK